MKRDLIVKKRREQYQAKKRGDSSQNTEINARRRLQYNEKGNVEEINKKRRDQYWSIDVSQRNEYLTHRREKYDAGRKKEQYQKKRDLIVEKRRAQYHAKKCADVNMKFECNKKRREKYAAMKDAISQKRRENYDPAARQKKYQSSRDLLEGRST